MIDLRKFAREARSKVRTLRNIAIYESYINCGITSTEEFIEKKIEESNIKIPEILKTVFLQYGNHNFKWKVLDRKRVNRIIIAYNSIYSTEYFNYGGFQNRKSVKNNDDYFPVFYTNAEDVEFWKQFYILDDLYFGKLILIKPDEYGDDHELFLFDHPNSINKLTINLEQYFELSAKTAGLYCWQEYVTEESYELNGEIPDNFHDNMNVLFPDEDLSMFRAAPKLKDSVYNRYVARKDKTDYRRLFINKIEELRRNPNIEFISYEDSTGFKIDKTPYTAHYGVSEAVLRKVKSDYGREISEQMLSFYYQMNGCKVSWRYNSPDEEDFLLEGSINLLELEEVLGGKWKESYLEWNSPDLFKDEGSVYYFTDDEAKENPEIAELMTHARIFDEQGDMQDYFIDFVAGKEEPDIYKVNGTSYYKMNIDFITFIEVRLEFAGIKGWEYSFIDHPDYSRDFIDIELSNFRRNVLKILPNANLVWN
jgi:hypothetical protein